MDLKEKGYNRRERMEWLVIMLVVSLLCMIPCMGKLLPQGDDMTFHILRIESVYHAIKTGQGFPAYIYDKLLEGYGYGAGIFYPDILLLPAILLRFMGLSPAGAMKGYIFLLLLLTCYTSYRAGKVIGKSHFVGLVTMVLYTMGHYHLEDIYRRSAMGEVVAMAFIPLVFLALYDYTEREERRKGLLCLVFSGLLLCHTISFVLCVGIAVVWVLIRIRKVWDKKHILGVLAEILGCVLLTAFYWIPVLEQFADGTFYVSTNPAFETQDEMMTMLGIVSGRLSVSFAELGIFLLLVMLGLRSQIKNKKAILCLCLAVGLLLIETRLFPWKLIDKTPLISLQFPWRLNMFTEFFVAFGIGNQLYVLYRHRLLSEKNCKLCFVLCVLIGVFNLSVVWQVEILRHMDYSYDYIETPANTNEIGFCEWLPSEADRGQTVFSDNSGTIWLYGENEKTETGEYHPDGSYSFDINSTYDSCIVPKYYYKGYEATVADPTGSQELLPISKDSDTGLIRLELNGKTGTVHVWYEKTAMQMVSKWISMIGLLLFIAFGVIQFLTKHKSGRENTGTQYI